MADFTIVDVAKQPQNSTQTGLTPNLYFFKQSENAAITFDATTREVDAITMSTGNEAYAVRANIDEALANHALAGGTSDYGVQTLTFNIDQLTSANLKALQPYDNSTGLCCLVVLANGERLLYGIDFDTTNVSDDFCWCSKFNAGENASGTRGDSTTTTINRMNRTYSWNGRPPVFVDKALSLSTLTTAAA